MEQPKKKILVVDDDEDILSLVTFLLLKEGFDVCTHPTGLGVLPVSIITRNLRKTLKAMEYPKMSMGFILL